MPIVERNVIVPLGLEEAWEALFGNEMQNWCELSDIAAEIRDFRWREDGTPTYVMVNRVGLLRASHGSDYGVYEPHHRAEDDTLESSLRGRWVTPHEPVEGGTLVTHRSEVEPHGLIKALFPIMKHRFEEGFQSNLETMAQRIQPVVGGS